MLKLLDNGGTHDGKVFNDTGDIAFVLYAPRLKTDKMPDYWNEIRTRVSSLHYVYPQVLEVGKSKAPLRQLRLGWARVLREIKLHCPQVKRVLVTGATDMLRVIVPKLEGDMQDAHGTLFLVNDLVVVPTFHEYYPHQAQWVNRDVKRLLRLERPSEPLPHTDGWVPNRFDDIDSLVIDVETDGKTKGEDVTTHSLTSVGVQWSATERAILTTPEQWLPFFKCVALDPPDNVVMHNAAYDLTFVGQECRDAVYGRVRDTMIRARARGEHVAGLKHLGNLYTARPGNYCWAVAGEVHNFDDPAYVFEDLDVTWRLWQLWRNETTQSTTLYEKCASVFCQQTIKGSYIDKQMLANIVVEGKALEAELRAGLVAKFGCEPGSGEFINALQAAGYTFSARTKSGELSLTADILTEMGLEEVVDWRKAQKLDGAFVNKINVLLRPNGTLPHHQKVCEAATGRTSMTAFNWQQAGRKGPVRKLMVSRFVGGHIGAADLAQNELRAACYGSNDAVFAAALTASDMHRENAAIAFGMFPGEVTDEQRTDAKTVVFRKIFGGRPQNEGQERVETMLNTRFPKLMKWLSDQMRKSERECKAVSAWGKVRKLDDVLDYRGKYAVGRAGVNSPIQGIASDFALWLTVRVWELLRTYNSLVLCGIHDSIMFDIFPGEEGTVKLCMAQAFSELGCLLRQQFPMASILPLEAELQLGDNWADTKNGEKFKFSTNTGVEV